MSVYGCGDVCIDLHGCDYCKKSIKGDVLDILKKLPSDSYVIFESCVLEYLDEKKKELVLKEIKRVSPNNFFEVRINPSIFIYFVYQIPSINSFVEYGI